MSRIVVVVALVVAIIAVGLLSGCPKKEQAELQGAPSTAPQPAGATHTMPGGMKMEGAQHTEQTPQAAAGKEVATGNEMASCPVLGTTMSKDKMIPYEYKGKTYYFCCQPCVEKFKADPEKYIKNPAKPKPPGQGM